jgi:hypothetical protein
MITFLRRLLKGKRYEYRVVKEEKFDKITSEYVNLYYIEKKTGMFNWTHIGRKFEDYSECLLWFDKYKQYLNRNEIEYEYLD